LRRAGSAALRLPTGRRSKFLVIAAWFVVLVAVGRNSVDLTKIQKSDPADYIPSNAEAAKARDQAVRFVSGRLTPAAVIYRRDGGLTAADRAKVASDRAAFGSGPQPVGVVDAPVFSRDGTSALTIVRVRPQARGTIDAVKSLRRRARSGGQGLKIAVTGAAGFSADAADVFRSIDASLFLATLLLVLVLLIAIYRSPTFWVLPVTSIVFALVTARGIAYLLGKHDLTITGQAGGIMTVLVFGVGTDYALLLVARYREALTRHDDAHAAAAEAIRQAAPAIVASSLTVIAGLLCLEAADVRATAGLGAIGAAGVAVALLAILTLLPALLCTFGRRAFWPVAPRVGSAEAGPTGGIWARIAERVAATPRPVWVASLLLLGVMAIGLLNLNSSLTTAKGFRNDVDAVKGQRLVARAFPPGVSAPAYVIVPDAGRADGVRASLARDPAVASVGTIERSGGVARFEAALRHDPYGETGFDDIRHLRTTVRRAGGKTALVGGPTAVEADLRTGQAHDNRLIIPLVLVLVLVILALLLRAIVAPLLLVGTVVASFAATLGLASVVFGGVFGYAGLDPALPLLSFILLVALGCDYNIFLMTRVRGETALHGAREGTVRGLTATGGVITSAGVVLAGTFCMLALLPLVSLTEIGLTIAFGALLDTFLVRSLLVPALVLDIGPATWWPSRLARAAERR
jgi:putative drug exporter of the RND superfamily